MGDPERMTMKLRPSRPAIWVGLMLLSGILLLGCRARADPIEAVAALARTFPVIERLKIETYWNEDQCTYLVYGRGSFSESPYVDNPCPFDVLPPKFDPHSQADFELLAREFAQTKLDVVSAYILLGADGRVGAHSYFSLSDGCLNYIYDPGWTSLPEDESGRSSSKGIDENWYQVDFCTPG